MASGSSRTLRVGLVGAGMIVDETYRPALARLRRRPLFDREYGPVEVQLVGVASRTGQRAQRLLTSGELGDFAIFSEPNSVERLLELELDAVFVATPDDRHFAAARAVLAAGKSVLIEKPSVLRLEQLDTLVELSERQQCLAKVVYHKLLDPDHKKLRTLFVDGILQNVSSGYCSLLEPKQIALSQFQPWIAGRNPATYVAVHYIKLIDFTFGGRLRSVTATGQRGIAGPPDGNTWDSVQMRLVYEYANGRTAGFDIHTSWVTPDNFPGYVEQEVQFRFDNGVWNGHGRKRGVELTVEDRTPNQLKNSLNNHYNGAFLEPWDQRDQRGYGIEVIERFCHEAARWRFADPADRPRIRRELAQLRYNDLSADRQTVAAVEAVEAILRQHAAGTPDCVVVNAPDEGLLLLAPGCAERTVLYSRPL